MKNQKGITLIALVVTIIVLLILAGVAIAMLTGENGILGNASNASSNNAYTSANDQVRLAYMAVRTEIMAKKVANSAYNPAGTESDELSHLIDLVSDDLTNDSKFTIENESTAAEDASHKAFIHIKYSIFPLDAQAGI